MRGSIRTLVGLILVMMAAGGLDNALDSQLPTLLVAAAIGLALMASGVSAMNRK